jgi:hypothetical protein
MLYNEWEFLNSSLYSYVIVHDSDYIYDVFKSKAQCMLACFLILTILVYWHWNWLVARSYRWLCRATQCPRKSTEWRRKDEEIIRLFMEKQQDVSGWFSRKYRSKCMSSCRLSYLQASVNWSIFCCLSCCGRFRLN